MQIHVCVRVPELVRRLFSQCSGLIRKGATRLTSVLESCGTPRGDSTYLPLSDNSVAAGDGGGSENTLRRSFAPMLRALVFCLITLATNSCGRRQRFDDCPAISYKVLLKLREQETALPFEQPQQQQNGEGFSLYFKLRGTKLQQGRPRR